MPEMNDMALIREYAGHGFNCGGCEKGKQVNVLKTFLYENRRVPNNIK